MTGDDDETIRFPGLADLVDPDPTAYVERYRPPVPPARRRLCPDCRGVLGMPDSCGCGWVD